MYKPKISIIMAVYNNEMTLREAINSIIAQTFHDWEFIICDDCSTDNTLNILKEYKKEYPNKIILIHNKKNLKLAASLNKCLQFACGIYIARMDGDDVSLPQRLEKQIKFIEQHEEFDLVGTAMIPFDKHGDRTIRKQKLIPTKYDLVKSPCFNHATILMKKEVFDFLKGYSVLPRTQRGQDGDLWFRFFAAGFKGFNMQEPLYKVRESVDDLKRRTFLSRVYAMQTRYFGFKLLHYPWYYFYYVLKPLIVGLIPRHIMHSYHNK